MFLIILNISLIALVRFQDHNKNVGSGPKKFCSGFQIARKNQWNYINECQAELDNDTYLSLWFWKEVPGEGANRSISSLLNIILCQTPCPSSWYRERLRGMALTSFHTTTTHTPSSHDPSPPRHEDEGPPAWNRHSVLTLTSVRLELMCWEMCC